MKTWSEAVTIPNKMFNEERKSTNAITVFPPIRGLASYLMPIQAGLLIMAWVNLPGTQDEQWLGSFKPKPTKMNTMKRSLFPMMKIPTPMKLDWLLLTATVNMNNLDVYIVSIIWIFVLLSNIDLNKAFKFVTTEWCSSNGMKTYL